MAPPAGPRGGGSIGGIGRRELMVVGGGAALGAAYLLWRRRQLAAAGASSTPAVTGQTPLSSASSGQQPSLVPYYLTANQPGGAGPGAGLPAGWDFTSGAVPSPVPITNSGAAPANPAPVSTSGTAPPTPPPPPTPTAPSPGPGPANLPPDVLQKIQANGENLIGSLVDPLTGGTWWFGSKGGVFAVNGARFLGSVPSVGAYFPGLNIIQATRSGNGYRLVSAQGGTYNFGA